MSKVTKKQKSGKRAKIHARESDVRSGGHSDLSAYYAPTAENPIPPFNPDGTAGPTLSAGQDSGDLFPSTLDDGAGGPYNPDNTDGPTLARHEQSERHTKGRVRDSNGMPLFPVTPHHTHDRKIKGFGWIRDIPDARDHFYAAPLFLELPAQYSLRHACPPVYDQMNLGSCAANAIAAAVQFERIRQSLPHSGRVPSRLFIYYNQRLIERDVTQDRGAQIRDGIKCVAALGACFEGSRKGEWHYDERMFAERPPEECYKRASLDRAVGYSRVRQQLDQLRGCIASGWPFVFGFTCYESMESASVAHGGVLPLPRPSEHTIGSHAVMAVGYNDINGTFEVRNSWGTNWGNGGYFTMPYSYVTDPNLSADFWTIRLVSTPS